MRFGRMGELVSAVSVRYGTMTTEQVWTFERLLRQELPRATVHVCSGREVSAPYAAVITCPPFVHAHVTEHVAMLARMAMDAQPVTAPARREAISLDELRAWCRRGSLRRYPDA